MIEMVSDWKSRLELRRAKCPVPRICRRLHFAPDVPCHVGIRDLYVLMSGEFDRELHPLRRCTVGDIVVMDPVLSDNECSHTIPQILPR